VSFELHSFFIDKLHQQSAAFIPSPAPLQSQLLLDNLDFSATTISLHIPQPQIFSSGSNIIQKSSFCSSGGIMALPKRIIKETERLMAEPWAFLLYFVPIAN
jgi:hypothetical protein